MNKKEYDKQFKNVDGKSIVNKFNDIKNMTIKQRQELSDGIMKTYEKELTDNLTFWISMIDYSNHIRNVKTLDNNKSVFITSNQEFIKFMKLLKKRINNLEVISINDLDKTMKKIRKWE